MYIYSITLILQVLPRNEGHFTLRESESCDDT